MKRKSDLYKEFCSFANLYRACQKAQKGKRYKYSTANFNFNLERNIINIQNELLTKNYKFGRYCSFYVYDPQKRLISAVPYQDRVVYHAICNIIEFCIQTKFVEWWSISPKSRTFW